MSVSKEVLDGMNLRHEGFHFFHKKNLDISSVFVIGLQTVLELVR